VFPCTEQGIRDAIAKGGGPYRFACPQEGRTVELSQPLILDQDVILDGESRLELRAAFLRRVFSVLVNVDATLIGIGMLDGYDDQEGGCIHNAGSLQLVNVVVKNCRASEGGGIYNDDDAEIDLIDTSVFDNTASILGGGICNRSGTLTLMDSDVSRNTALYGGGIYNGGTATLTSSTVSSNTGDGGGIYNDEGLATLTIASSSVSGNIGGHVGGIYGGATMTLTNSTVSMNTAEGIGGIWADAGPVTIRNSTVSKNTGESVGGLLVSLPRGRLTMTSSTVSGNIATASPDTVGGIGSSDGLTTITNSLVDNDCRGVIISSGYNMESGDTCGFGVSNADLRLGQLAANGGPTMTHALLPGSVAIDKIPEAACVDADAQPLTTDQRGQPRPETDGTMCDVGSFEVQP